MCAVVCMMALMASRDATRENTSEEVDARGVTAGSAIACALEQGPFDLPEVSRRRSLSSHPSLIQRLHHIIRQRALFQIRKIALQLLQAANSNDDTVVSAFDSGLQFGVVDAPSQRYFEQGKIMLLRSIFGNLESLEGGIFEVAVAVHASDSICFGAETAFVGLDVFGFDFPGEETAG